MSTASCSTNDIKIPNSRTKESSHLLESTVNGDKYGSGQAEQDSLLGNMVHTATENKSRTLTQYIAALAAAGGAFACGTLLGWTSPAQTNLDDGTYDFKITADQFSWVGSMVTLGAAVVCIPIGFLINILGRKPTMLLLVLPFSIGWCLLIWAQNLAMMYVARFILGIAGGAFCVTAPMYTGEIAQKEIRGSLGSFFQLMITMGILFVYVIGSALNIFWMSIVCGILPLIFGIIFVFMPESPTYLVKKNRQESAIKSFKWLRGPHYDYNAELEELKATEAEIQQQEVHIFAALTRTVTLKALGISLGLMLFQQLSGINAVIFYTKQIFEDANTGISANLSTILVGVMQVVATFVSSLVVDKLGRRILLLASAIVMALSTIAMGIYFYMKDQDKDSVVDLGWLPVSSLCVFIIMFSIGFGPVPWLMMGELFASDIKGFAGSLTGTTNWVLAFIVTKTFNNLNTSLGAGQTFWLFAAITIVGVIFVFFVVPETKGKSLNEIQKELGGNIETSSITPTRNGPEK